MTAAEVLQARGEAIGVVKGRAEGKAEVVLRQLRLKFGEVPEAVRERILGTASEELDVFADRIITSGSLEDVIGTGTGK